MPKYGVHVFIEEDIESVAPFEKPQEAHSYMIFMSRKLAGDFYKIIVSNHGDSDQQIEVMMGKKSRI